MDADCLRNENNEHNKNIFTDYLSKKMYMPYKSHFLRFKLIKHSCI